MWYYVTEANEQQKVSAEQLRQLVSQGVIRPSTMVWTQGMAEWQPASAAVPNLFQGAATDAVSSPPPRRGRGRADDIDYEIFGDDMQVVEVELDPQETVIAEAGAMNYMEDGIAFETRMGDGSQTSAGLMGVLKSVGQRVLTGESVFMTHFTNTAGRKRRVAFAAPYPGRIIPVALDEIGGEIVCQKDAFLCAARGTQLSIALNRRIGSGFFGGEGFILQRLRGDGLAFLHAGGTVIQRQLNNDTLRLDTGCLVAYTPGIDYSIERAGNLRSMFFGGEGLFLATLRGTGTVYLQSLPFSRLADRILQHAPSSGGSSQGEGLLQGGLGALLDDD